MAKHRHGPLALMRRIRQIGLSFLLGPLLFATSALTLAESGILVVHVKDVQEHPIAGIQVGVTGDGGSATTGDDGKARIPLAKQTKENDWVSLQIVKSPPGEDFMMVSPWDHGTLVPSFANESKNVVEVVVVQRGDRLALMSGTVLKALAEKINKANALKTIDKQVPQEDPKASLAAVAKQYGLAPDSLDQAIRAWGAKTTDPYEAGLAALYERNFAKATAQLANSLQRREEELAADQKAVADAAFFLAESLSEQGRYREAIAAYQRCLEIHPDNPAVLNNLALAFQEAGDFNAAEKLSRRSLSIQESTSGPEDPELIPGLAALGTILFLKGDFATAEPLLERALAIGEKNAPSTYPLLAPLLSNLAGLFEAKGDYPQAESLFRRALAIDEKAPDHNLAFGLSNLAGLFVRRGNYPAAEPLYEQALAIDEKMYGPDHPYVAKDLANRALLL